LNENFYYQDEGDSWTYDTGIQTFSTCEMDGITPIINIINPVNDSAYSDILDINVELSDNKAIGYSQLIINDTDTLEVFHNQDNIIYELDTFNLQKETNILKIQCWDVTGEYSETDISFHILDQIRIRSWISTEVHFTSHDIISILNILDILTISFNQFTDNEPYSWTTQGISTHDNIFGDIISVNGLFNADDLFTIIELRIPEEYRFIILRDDTQAYSNFIVKGNLIEYEDVATVIYDEKFSKEDFSSSSNYYYLGYFDVTRINEIEFSGCMDSTFTPVETRYFTNEEIIESGSSIYLILEGN